LAEIWGLLRDFPANSSKEEALLALAVVFDMDKVLGLGLEAAINPPTDGTGIDEALVQEVEALIAKRTEAKKAKDFATADSIRQNLKEKGIILEDGPTGTKWKYGN
jgi:cysteinyl-tRNA synthetase